MELKNDTTENNKFAYENPDMPNPNDTLFRGPNANPNDTLFRKPDMNPTGGFGGNGPDDLGLDDLDKPYKLSASRIPKTQNPTGFLIIVIVGLVMVMALGIYLIKGPKGSSSSSSYDGTYVMARAETEGMVFTIEELESWMGGTYSMTLKIDGKHGYLEVEYMDVKEEGKVDIEIDGDDIKVSNSGEVIIFKYNSEDDTIYYEEDGARMIFEKVD